MKTAYPKVLPPPSSPTTCITEALLQPAIKASRQSPRKRIILPLHKDPSAPVQRMINAMQPGSYIRPHSHNSPPKTETIIVLRGAILNVTFSLTGEIETVQKIEAGGTLIGLDCEPGIIHTFITLKNDTVLFEAKTGPFEPASDKDFAPWAPDEDDSKAASYLKELTKRSLAIAVLP